MKRLRGFLGILMIFGLGVVIGGLLGFGAGWMGFFHRVVKGGPVAVREILFTRARDDLKLDYEQEEEVRLILKESSLELDRITAGVRPSVEEALGRAEERIRAVLKPEQRRKFDAFVNDGRRKWKPGGLPGAATTPEAAPTGSKPDPGANKEIELPKPVTPP